jgi:hypothetical protein
MAKKNENTLLILAGVALVGYFAFKNGLFTHPAAVAAPAVQPGAALLPPSYAVQDPHQIAIEQPAPDVIGIYAPNLDPTGRSITLY